MGCDPTLIVEDISSEVSPIGGAVRASAILESEDSTVKRALQLLALTVLAALTSFGADFSGAWKCINLKQTLNIKQDGAKITGTLQNTNGNLRIAESKLDGDNITLTFMVVLSNGVDPLGIAGYDSLAEEGQVTEITYKGTIAGDEIKFKVTQERLEAVREFTFKKTT